MVAAGSAGAAAPATPGQPPDITGEWAAPPGALPNAQLPHVPLLGNGRVGLLLDAHAPAGGGPPAGPARRNALDVWVGSNSMWSCDACGGGLAPGCCRLVTVGGMSINLQPGFPAGPQLNFSATQALGPALLGSVFTTPAGGTLTTTTRLHPSLNLATTTVSWEPGAGDPPALALNVSVWTLSAVGRPFSVGCAAGSPVAVVACDASGATAQTIFVSRQATANRSASPLPVAAGLAAAFSFAGGARASGFAVTAAAATGLWEATASLLLPAGDETVTVTLCEIEQRPADGSDPGLAAAALIAAGPSAPDIAAAAADFWLRYWALSGVSTPARPELEQLWYGAQYALAGTSAEEASVPGPGLYGVWSSSDSSSWNGDFTLDYNYESTHFGAFSSHHGDRTAGYFPPILAWLASGGMAAMAAQESAASNISSPPGALHMPCHIAPWGMQSLDQSVYMHWNGLFAMLPFISRWEYELDSEFAASTTLPLLQGLNAWYYAFLRREVVDNVTGAYIWHDDRPQNEDEEGEGQRVPDPQIGLALVARTFQAQADISRALGYPVPAWVLDVLENLKPFNTGNFTHTYTPPGGANATAQVNLTAWTVFGGASVKQSMTFALYPIFPSEFLVSTGAALDDATARVAMASAAAYVTWGAQWLRMVDVYESCVLAGWGYLGKDSVAGLVAARARSAAPAAAAAEPAVPPWAYSPADVLDGLRVQLQQLFGPNMLMYAPGGGVETIGVSLFLNHMLVGAEGGRTGPLRLFPFWPAAEPAAFSQLLAKGGLLVSASWNNVTASVASPITVRAEHTLLGAPFTTARLADPWGDASATVSCGGGATAPVAWAGSGAVKVMSWRAPLGVDCLVAHT